MEQVGNFERYLYFQLIYNTSSYGVSGAESSYQAYLVSIISLDTGLYFCQIIKAV